MLCTVAELLVKHGSCEPENNKFLNSSFLLYLENVSRTCSHYVNQSSDFIGMFSGRVESLKNEYFEVFKHITALTTHDLEKMKT